MLRWLKINRYRNVVPGTELTFSEGHHVLLGPNGGGKTTLLELIAAVLRGDFSGLADEDFSLEYRLSQGNSELEMSISHERASASRGPRDPEWNDLLTANLRHGLRGTRKLELNDGRLFLEGEELRTHGVDLKLPSLHILLSLYAWESEDGPIAPDLSWFGAYRFDESLSFFAFIRGQEALGEGAYVTVTRVLSEHPPKLFSYSHSLFRSVAAAISEALKESTRVLPDRVAIPLTALGSINQIVELVGLRSGDFYAEIDTQTPTSDGDRLTCKHFSFRFVRLDGTMVRDEHLSFGQKRLLAFLFYAWANDGPIVADELVDGMHYRWIEHCLKTIRGRQAFLSSQNPLLMDFIGFDSAEKVQQTFVICDVEERDGRERMRWRNLTPDEAGDFFNAYEVGIQHVSEILRDKGLW